MANAYEGLVAEIDRIVLSPFPSQLKGLRDLVCTKCSRTDVTRWALSRPCQVDRLAECLLEGLRQWPYVLELVTRLSNDTIIRDALLRQSPELLHDIVSYAAKAGSLDSKYVEATVTMLSHPLPENVCMPSEAQSLFLRLFDQAAEEPTLPNIRRVYQMLQGTSSLLLGLLTSSSLVRLEQHLFAIIKNIKGENQSLSLYCLAIMKAMCSASKDDFRLSNSQYDTQELLASTELSSASKWTSDGIQQFFSDSKAQKTVQLVVLRAMWSCTTSTGELFDERMESLLLANEVISAVPPHLRELWRKANSLIVGKLQDKVVVPALEPELKYQGLCFLAQISEGSRVPATVLDGLRRLAVHPHDLHQALAGSPTTQLDLLIEAGVLDETATTALLQNTVDFATGTTGEDWLATSNLLRNMLEQIYSAMASDTKLGEGVMLALDVIACGQKLRKLCDLACESDASSANDRSDRVCGAAISNSRSGLIHSLCKVFLRAALSSTHQSYSASQDTICLLLRLHASSVRRSCDCSHVKSFSRRRADRSCIVEAVSSPEDYPADWRGAIQQHIQSQARTEEDRLTAIFAKACASLETRCADVEAPLREERQKYEALGRQFGELQRSYASLEEENTDRNVRLHAVEIERDQTISELEMLREETDAHERKTEELLAALQQARDESRQALEKAKGDTQAIEMEHAVSLARKDEEIEELQVQVQHVQHQMSEKTAEVDSTQGELRRVQESLESTRGELSNARDENEELRDTGMRLQQEKDEALENRENVLEKLQAARQDSAAQREAFERDLSDLKEQADANFVTATVEHEAKITGLTRQYEESAESLRKQLAEVQEEVDQAREQHRADIEQWETEIREKQKKVDRLSRKCSEKDKQIAEANSMRTNLMAAMGLGGAPTNDGALPHRPSRSSATQRTQPPPADSQDDPTPPTPFSADDSQQAEIGNASFASTSSDSRSGPTPKRPRPRKSIPARSPAKPTARLSVSTRSGARASLAPPKGRSSVKLRQPLLGVSGNQSRLPARPMLKTPSKGLEEDEEMFGGSEIFAGTQGMEMLRLGGGADEETETVL